MYFYENHMGGIYSSCFQRDYDELYCETCGDCDWEIGCVDTCDEAVELLRNYTATFDEHECDSCPRGNGEFASCDERCEGYKYSGGYSCSYISSVLASAFPEAKFEYCVLMCRHQNEPDYFLVNVFPSHYSKDSNIMDLITAVAVPKYAALVGRALCNYAEEGCLSDIQEIASTHLNGKKYHIYLMTEPVNPSDDTWKDSCHSASEGWIGYMHVDEILARVSDKELFKFALDAVRQLDAKK